MPTSHGAKITATSVGVDAFHTSAVAPEVDDPSPLERCSPRRIDAGAPPGMTPSPSVMRPVGRFDVKGAA